MKYTKEKMTGLNGPFWNYCLESEDGLGEFFLTADRRGISLSGDSPIFYNREDLQVLAQVIGDAWTEHEKLKPRLDINLAGH